MTSKTETCQNCQKEFIIERDERAVYEEADIPLSKECHRCRVLRLMSFWLFGKFRKGKSDLK